VNAQQKATNRMGVLVAALPIVPAPRPILAKAATASPIMLLLVPSVVSHQTPVKTLSNATAQAAAAERPTNKTELRVVIKMKDHATKPMSV
jgi:hypothetical protein